MADNPSPYLVPGRPHKVDSRAFHFWANKRMSDMIISLSKERHSSLSDTLRMLINLGHQTYEINGTAGINTTEKNKAALDLKMAEAELAALQKKQKKKPGKNAIPAVTPMLYGDPEPDE